MKKLYETKQQLAEGLFDAIIGALAGGTAKSIIKKIKKDPGMKKAIGDYESSKQKLKKQVDDYVKQYGKMPDLPGLDKHL